MPTYLLSYRLRHPTSNPILITLGVRVILVKQQAPNSTERKPSLIIQGITESQRNQLFGDIGNSRDEEKETGAMQIEPKAKLCTGGR